MRLTQRIPTIIALAESGIDHATIAKRLAITRGQVRYALQQGPQKLNVEPDDEENQVINGEKIGDRIARLTALIQSGELEISECGKVRKVTYHGAE